MPTRRDIIQDFINALTKLDGFDYSTEQMWDFCHRAVKEKKMRKISVKKDTDTDASSSKKKKVSGYNLFFSNFQKTNTPPEDVENKKKWRSNSCSEAWNVADKELWEKKANELNELNGFISIPKAPKIPKAKPPTKEELKKTYYSQLSLWQYLTSQIENAIDSDIKLSKEKERDQQFPDGEPVQPEAIKPKQKSSSPKSQASNTPKSSNSEDNDTLLLAQMEELQLSEKSQNENSDNDDSDNDDSDNSDSDNDDGNDDDDDDDDEESDNEDFDHDLDNSDKEQIEWLKTLEWKNNVSSHFRGYIMFKHRDVFGPDKHDDKYFKKVQKTYEEQYKYKDDKTNKKWRNFLKNKVSLF